MLAYANLSDANLRGSKLRDADLFCTNLYGAHLENADISAKSWGINNRASAAIMIRAHLEGTNLQGRDLNGAKLNEAFLIQTDLSPGGADREQALWANFLPRPAARHGKHAVAKGTSIRTPRAAT